MPPPTLLLLCLLLLAATPTTQQQCASQASSIDLLQSGNTYIYNHYASTANNPAQGREHLYDVIINFNVPAAGIQIAACNVCVTQP